ncbi:MAG: hypothetical protein QOG89_1252, partial [Thermomicrobiales bacterium]|nr:hypothetical protein [Thermomicrobiales bacterium]
IANPISMGDMNAQKAIVDSHLRCFQKGTERVLVARAVSALTEGPPSCHYQALGVRR